MKMINKEQLEPLVYALTIADRPNKRHLWLARGFRKVNRRPGFLLAYWEKRLSNPSREDAVLYAYILERYNKVLERYNNITPTIEN